MIFKIKNLNEKIYFVYGFLNNAKIYDMVLTVENKPNKISEIHALISRVPIDPPSFVRLWEAIIGATKSEWFEFEVFPEHAKAYKIAMDIATIKKTKTFDGYDSEILTVHRNTKLKFQTKKIKENKFRKIIRRLQIWK